MSPVNDLVTIEKCAALLGISEEAIRQYKKKGHWHEKVHCFKAPNGRIFISLKAINSWIQGKGA